MSHNGLNVRSVALRSMDRYLHQAGCSSDASIGEVSESAGAGTEGRQREDEQVGLQTQATLPAALRCAVRW